MLITLSQSQKRLSVLLFRQVDVSGLCRETKTLIVMITVQLLDIFSPLLNAIFQFLGILE